jgi:hypothetical protein
MCRELGCGVMQYLSALAGLSVAILIQQSSGEDRVNAPVYGPIAGSVAWLAYKRFGLASLKT